MLDRVLGDHARVEGGAAGDDDDLVDLAQHGGGDAHLVEGQQAARVDPAQQRVGDGLGLLGDLLEHEVVVAALLGGGGVPVDVVRPDVGGLALEVRDGDPLAAQFDDLVLAEFDGVAGVRDEGRDIGGEEVLAVADAHDERGVAAGADHDVRLVGVHGHQGEGAFEAAADLAHRLGEVPDGGVGLGEEVGDDLGVGLGEQVVAALGEFGAQGGEVLDDAVVDDGDPARVVQVRVRVGVRGTAVGGPAGARGRRGRPQRALVQQLLQVGELAGLLGRGQAAVGEDGDTRRVVAPVLEPLQTRDDNVEGGLAAHVTNDSAHEENSRRRRADVESDGERRKAPDRDGPGHPGACVQLRAR